VERKCVGAVFCEPTIVLNLHSKKMFELLGFAEEVNGGDTTLKPPSTDITSTHGKLNRRKLLRAWLEFGSYVADYKRVNGSKIACGSFHLLMR
jgi:hypothetical protein